jgi:hypothetical protein
MSHRSAATLGEPIALDTRSRSDRRREAQHHAPCQQRLAREKAGRAGIDLVFEDREDVPGQLVEVVRSLPSVVIRTFDLSALEPNRKATAAAERRLQELRPGLAAKIHPAPVVVVQKHKESSAALIQKSEAAVLVCGTRHVLDLRSANDTQHETQKQA